MYRIKYKVNEKTYYFVQNYYNNRIKREGDVIYLGKNKNGPMYSDIEGEILGTLKEGYSSTYSYEPLLWLERVREFFPDAEII